MTFAINPNEWKRVLAEANICSVGGSDELLGIVSNSNLRVCFTPIARLSIVPNKLGAVLYFCLELYRISGLGRELQKFSCHHAEHLEVPDIVNNA